MNGCVKSLDQIMTTVNGNGSIHVLNGNVLKTFAEKVEWIWKWNEDVACDDDVGGMKS